LIFFFVDGTTNEYVGVTISGNGITI